ncbi:PREDICTED: translocating chain-associated membrane protein 2 [Charadrius vociferus]|uniref:translocating chain-associated membrane protein 2 n=1 Tax=Charadrius vociferus TaxID=50402 RepID=UPI0005214CDD|nr:PREDICTED: translocating chain-associated membrane protein 2 [Charadrius vociferus]
MQLVSISVRWAQDFLGLVVYEAGRLRSIRGVAEEPSERDQPVMLDMRLGSRVWPAQGSALLPKLLFALPRGTLLSTCLVSKWVWPHRSHGCCYWKSIRKDAGAKSIRSPWGFEATELPQVTAKTAFLFILPQYNVSVPTADGELVQYHYGLKDLVTILFYIFIAIILHAVVQEYALDKINRRLHLSKVKHSKFNESGQLVAFHLTSMVWCLYVVVTEGYISNPRSLWENYPHVYLPFQVKFFYLCQLAYWLHALPELYFQKVRKEEIPRQLRCIALYLVHIAGAYLLNLTRLGLILLLLQYLAEFFFHMARLVYFTDENNEKLFNVWAVVFVVTRLFTLTLYILVIGFGLPRVENQALDPERGNFFSFLFNNILFRMSVLLLVCLFQASVMWRFIHFQLRRWREYWNEQSSRKRAAASAQQQAKPLKRSPGYHENGVVKAENGTSPRTKKLKSP